MKRSLLRAEMHSASFSATALISRHARMFACESTGRYGGVRAVWTRSPRRMPAMHPAAVRRREKPALLPNQARARIMGAGSGADRSMSQMMKLAGAQAAASDNDPIAGVAWITVSMALFAGLAVFSRMAMNAGLHPFEVVFLRNAFACVLFLPLLAYRGLSLAHSRHLGLYGVRVVVSLVSMQAWFFALFLIPIGEVTAISYLAPLFGTLGAVLLLGEKVRIRRWTALAVGFLGAMIILRPSGASLGAGQLCALLSAMSGGLTVVLVKQLTARDDPDKIVFLTNMLLLPLSLVPALFVWSWPSPAVLPALLGMGVCAVLGHVAVVRGYAATDASLGMTFEFSKLPFAAGIAFLAFGESIDAWTWLGAFVIFASAVYITRREAQLRMQRSLPASRPPGS
jgi:drug/metabolite transporter (DMT)-like permease